MLGVFLFADVKVSEPLNNIIHFRGVSAALLTLFRISTGENWQKVLYQIKRNPSIDYECIYEPEFEDFRNNGYHPIGCGKHYISTLYFLAFIIFETLVILNLFIAIIL